MNHLTILSLWVLFFSIPFLKVFVSYKKENKVWKKWILYVYMVSLFIFLIICATPTYPLYDDVKTMYKNIIFIFLMISSFIVPWFLLNIKNNKGMIANYKINYITICLFLYLLLIIGF